MKIILKIIAIFVAGIVVGSTINFGIIMVSSFIIPLPQGADNSSMEALKNSIHLFEPVHFIFPFLAHALGTLAGAFFASQFAPIHKGYIALSIGFFFLMGGVEMVNSLPSPLWFNILDIGLAYLPMSFAGFKLSEYCHKRKSQ